VVTSELLAYNLETEQLRSLGPTSQEPADMSWVADMSRAIYEAEGSPCATL
jgi:hypothetical protein